MISNAVQFEFISQISDKEGRFVLVRGKIDQKEVTLFNVYALPGSNITFFRRVLELITSETYGTLICARDFNILLNPSLDTTNRIRRRNLIEKCINNVLKDLGLIDVWRALNGSTPGYTSYSARHTACSRIDYFFMYNKDLHRLKYCRIGQRDLSDHSGIFLALHLDGRRRKTLWRLNPGMLNDHIFRSSMENDFASYIQDNNNGEVNPSILWDAAKAVLRGKIIAKKAALKKMKTQKLTSLQEKLRDLEQTHITNKEPSVIQQIRHTKQEIDKILSEEVEKNIKFMEQRYYEAGPRAAKLLTWRFRKQQAENTIHKIRDPTTNKITNNLDSIQKAFERYTNPYTPNQNRLINTQLLNSLTP